MSFDDQCGSAVGIHTISCHSCRHATGGPAHFSKHPVRTGSGYRSASNTRHMQFAWITLGTLALTDFYISCGGQWQHHRSQIYWLKDRFRSQARFMVGQAALPRRSRDRNGAGLRAVVSGNAAW